MSGRGKSRDNGQGGSSFAERLSPLIAKGGYKRGVIPVPGLLVHFQGNLGMTDGELVYVLHVLDQKRDGNWPWVAVSEIALRMHRDERNARSLKQSLQKKGYLVCRPKWKDDGTRGGDEHDLTGLFAQLERLAIVLETEEALDQVRSEQPEPMYYRGQIQMESTPPKRLRLAVRRRKRADGDDVDDAHASNGGAGGENAPTPLAKSPPAGRRKCPCPAGDFAGPYRDRSTEVRDRCFARGNSNQVGTHFAGARTPRRGAARTDSAGVGYSYW